MNHSLKRIVRAQWRDIRVLFWESRIPLLIFIFTVMLGGALVSAFYVIPETGEHPGLAQSFYCAFALIFFQPTLPFPEVWYLQALYFVVPFVGLAAVADGVLNFGAALMNKRQRGQKWQAAMASTFSNHVIVCGVGKVGYRVILELLKYGRDVVALDLDGDCRFSERVVAAGVPLIVGDARRQEVLQKAGVEHAEAIIPCTNDELANLDIALDARELNPDIRVVMRMFDPDFARRVEQGFGLQTALSASALAAPMFATAAMNVNVKHSFYLGDTLLAVSEYIISPTAQLAGWTLRRLEEELDLSVIGYQHGAKVQMHPNRDTCLSAGDTVLVLAGLKTLQRLDRLNGPA
jgi:Trk K+ transport system NAD-binding subunit